MAEEDRGGRGRYELGSDVAVTALWLGKEQEAHMPVLAAAGKEPPARESSSTPSRFAMRRTRSR